MKYIPAGECALAANGLIQLSGGLKQVWTLYKITPVTEGFQLLTTGTLMQINRS